MRISEYVSKHSRPKLQPIYKIKQLPYVILSLIFLALIVPLIFKPEMDIFDAYDEERFHYPTILSFAEEFPKLDLVDYDSATTPLYHIILMVPALIFGSNIIQLRFISAIISLCCLLVFYKFLASRGDARKALLFAILFLFSPYFVGPAIRLSTDNAALLFALLAIYTMETATPTSKKNLLINIFILCAIYVRQIYAWLIGAYLLFNLRGYQAKSETLDLKHIILPTLIPILGLAYFLFLWKGLTPPRFSGGHTPQGLNWDAPVYIVSLIGLYGIIFCFWLFKMFKQNQQLFPLVLLLGFSSGYLLLHSVSNEYPVIDQSLGDRGGALWLLAARLPNFLSTSVVFWVLFPLGLVCLYTMVRYLISRHEYLMIGYFLLWLAANMTNFKTYQKYYEPFLLFFMGYAMVTIKTNGDKYDWIGPVILLVGFISITTMRFFL